MRRLEASGVDRRQLIFPNFEDDLPDADRVQ